MKKPFFARNVVSGAAIIKFAILGAFVLSGILVFRYTNLKEMANPEEMGRLVQACGLWGPAAYIAVEAVAICLFVPASIMIILAATLFGVSWGFFCAWVGALLGACLAFAVGRSLGRDFVSSIIGGKLEKYDNAIANNGFVTVLYVRLLNCPFTPMNYGFSITRVRFRDYFLGTGLGVPVSIFVITFLSATLKNVWASGKWEELVSSEVGFALALFVFSFFIPVILKKIRAGGKIQPEEPSPNKIHRIKKGA